MEIVEPRASMATVRFVDKYCQAYKYLFSDVRSFEAYKYLRLRMPYLASHCLLLLCGLLSVYDPDLECYLDQPKNLA